MDQRTGVAQIGHCSALKEVCGAITEFGDCSSDRFRLGRRARLGMADLAQDRIAKYGDWGFFLLSI